MPITLPALTRRRWLQGGLAAALSSTRWLPAAPQDAETWVLFSDTHIAADAKAEARGACMAENLSRCVNQVLKLGVKPFGVLVNGDCAYLDGQAEDYATFAERIAPLRESGVQVHCTLGNHDHRKNFMAALTGVEDPRPVEGKHVRVLSSATMNWVLLDSLDQVNQTPGLLGDTQLGWLDRTLASLPDRPTVVMAHHNLQAPLQQPAQKVTGLTDGDEMLEILARHKSVKAFVYGHTHTWEHRVHTSGLHLVNLPPVAYVFNPARPNGWVVARATEKKLELELRALNPAHDQHGQTISIPWVA